MLTYCNNFVPLVQLKTINMPRQARKTSGTGIYHVMLRGINRQDIFEDDEDYMRFLQSLHQLVECYDERAYRIPSLCHFYAYCLMPNHVHLLIQEKTAAIGEIVKRITISYAYHFNKKYQRKGHLFQDRFRSEPVDDIGYFKTLLRYIHQNPVHAGLSVNVGEYPWSSWHEFEKREAVMDKLCDTDVVLRRILWEELWDFVLEPTDNDGGILEMDDEPPRSISDAGIKDLLRLQYGIVNVMDVQNLEKNQRNKIIKELCDQGAGFRQLARITGISYGIIQRVVTDQRTVP